MGDKVFNPDKKPPVVDKPELPKEVDPNKDFPVLVTPEGAMFVQKAQGPMSGKVAIAGFSDSNFGLYASSTEGTALFATGATFAAEFEGDVRIEGRLRSSGDYACGGNMTTAGNHIVGGDIQLSGADYAEDFDVADGGSAEPGTVMVLDGDGVRISDACYDRRVAGVVSGAGGYQPAVILDRHPGTHNRRPLALMGKVFCKADATGAPIEIGDLLTTSSRPGHAMKAADPARAAGAIIGKALRPLAGGLGLVPILVSLQ